MSNFKRTTGAFRLADFKDDEADAPVVLENPPQPKPVSATVTGVATIPSVGAASVAPAPPMDEGWFPIPGAETELPPFTGGQVLVRSFDGSETTRAVWRITRYFNRQEARWTRVAFWAAIGSNTTIGFHPHWWKPIGTDWIAP